MRCTVQGHRNRRCCHLKGLRFEGGARHHGFTLLETVIAMTLVSVLMLLVWSIFAIYTKLEAKGVVVAQEISLLRAIHRQMRDDLLCVVPIDPGRDPSMVSQISLASGATTPALPNGFFIGTASEIHFAIFDRPAGSKRLMSRIVSYQAQSLRSELLSTEEPDTDDPEPIDLPPNSLGLEPFAAGIERHVESWSQYLQHRTQQASLDDGFAGAPPSSLDVDDLLVIGPPDEFTDPDSDDTSEAPETTDPVPEVGRHQFRFYDGATWVDQWDSTFTGRLPLAIRFELDVDAPRDDNVEEPLDQENTFDESIEHEDAEFIDLDADALGLEDESQLEYRWVIAIDAAMRPAAPLTDSPTGDDEVFP